MAKGRSRGAVQAAAEAAADVLVGMIQPFAGPIIEQHKAGRARAGDGHHHPGRPRPPAGRAPGVRRRRRHDLRRQRRRDVRRHDRRALRVGQRQARGRAGVGGSPRHRHGRTATPTPTASTTPRCCRRSATRSPSTRIRACSSWRWPGAGRSSTSTSRPACPSCPSSTSSPSSWPWPSPDRRRSRTPGGTSSGVEHIPAAGPAILVANHRSYFDALAMTLVIARSGRTARFLGKKEVFDVPVVGQLAKAMGGIRVERASGSDEPLRYAAEALEAGQMVAIMPQGTIPRGPSFFDPELKGALGRGPAGRHDQGAGRPGRAVGHREGVAPLLPPAPHLERHRPARWSGSRVGPPVELKYRSPDADTKRIMKAIVDLLPAEARAAPRPDRGGAAPHLPARVQGRPGRGGHPPAGHRLIELEPTPDGRGTPKGGGPGPDCRAERVGAAEAQRRLATQSSPTVPSTSSRMRSAWPLWRAYSSIMWSMIQRRLTGSPRRTPVASSDSAAASMARARSHSAAPRRQVGRPVGVGQQLEVAVGVLVVVVVERRGVLAGQHAAEPVAAPPRPCGGRGPAG